MKLNLCRGDVVHATIKGKEISFRIAERFISFKSEEEIEHFLANSHVISFWEKGFFCSNFRKVKGLVWNEDISTDLPDTMAIR